MYQSPGQPGSAVIAEGMNEDPSTDRLLSKEDCRGAMGCEADTGDGGGGGGGGGGGAGAGGGAGGKRDVGVGKGIDARLPGSLKPEPGQPDKGKTGEPRWHINSIFIDTEVGMRTGTLGNLEPRNARVQDALLDPV